VKLVVVINAHHERRYGSGGGADIGSMRQIALGSLPFRLRYLRRGARQCRRGDIL
jgi:hypothetical protein